MKSKVYIITVEQILQSKVCVITDYLRGRVYSLGVACADELNCALVGMFNADGKMVISAVVKYVNGRRIVSQAEPSCNITDDDVYAWKRLIRQYRDGVNELGILPIKALESGVVTLGEMEMLRKKINTVWHRDSHLPWIKALQYATQFCGFYKRRSE